MVSVDANFIGSLIGTPFAYGGRGPHEYDCYGLVRAIHAHHSIDIPDYVSPEDGARISALMTSQLHLWEECEIQSGAVLLLRVPGSQHVGMCMSGNWMVHTWEASGGVVRERIDQWERRIIGAYKYVGK